MGTGELKVGDKPAMDLASHPGGIRNTSRFNIQKQRKAIWPDGPPGL